MIVESAAVAMIAALISSVSSVQSVEVDDMAIRKLSSIRYSKTSGAAESGD